MITLAPTYSEARRRFLHSAEIAGARCSAAVHPARGLHGEELAIDVAELGPDDAEAVLLMVSGTHGVEGYTGSALQSRWLERSAPGRPGAVKAVLVHALNPHGFSWVRRVNEDNVDLNRNFVDWSQPPPVNERYGGVASLLVPERWDEATQEQSTAKLLEEATAVGFEEFQEIVSGGQYAHPTGVFYGGAGPVWSHRWMAAELSSLVPERARVGLVDLHTGLGPSGHGELIVHAEPRSAPYRRAARWWGDVRSMSGGESVSANLSGDWLGALDDLLPGREVTAAALEFGTVDPVSVLQALRADAWLHAHGDPTGDGAAEIRRQVRAAFADERSEGWLGSVSARFDDVVTAALEHLESAR